MGLKVAGVGVAVLLLFCLSEAQWRGRSAQSQGRSVQAQGRSAQSQGRSAQSQGRSAQSQGRSAQSQGRSAQSQGRSALSQGRSALSQGRSALSQGRSALSQGRSALRSALSQGRSALSQGRSALSQGRFAISQGRSAQSQGRSAQSRKPNLFGPRSQGLQQSETTMPMFAPQIFPSQLSMQTPGVAGSFDHDSLGVQSKQLLQGLMEKLTWTFPSLPEEPVQPEIPFELQQPISPNSVAAQCGENSVYVEVKADFFGVGRALMASGFALGGCAATGEDNSAGIIVFETELHGCGSMLRETENELVYTFSLVYTPQEALSASPIVRSSGAAVDIECHYPRLHNVSSNILMPTWVPFAATKVAEERLIFSLKLMTDDWRFERPSNQYFLGDVFNIEASVRSYNHVPFRLFVDSCVATPIPDNNASPRYSFIENNGCLVDAKLTGSSSRFLPRTQNDKLQFQLEAFRFQQENSGLVYITCVLKVAAASTPTNAEQKACSYASNGWVSADESDHVCTCCDSTCDLMTGSDQLKDLQWETASVGPVRIKEYGFGHL